MRSIKEIVKLAGGPAAVGRKINRTAAAVSQWKSIPRAHVRAVSELSGLPVSDLMPDVFAGDVADSIDGRAA